MDNVDFFELLGMEKNRQSQLAELQDKIDKASEKHDLIDSNLSDLKSQQDELDAQRNAVAEELKASSEEISKAQAEFDELKSKDAEMLQRLDDARKTRNDQFINWLFNEYPDLNDFTFDELCTWIQKKSFSTSTSTTSSGGGAKKEKQLDVQDSEQIARDKVASSIDITGIEPVMMDDESPTQNLMNKNQVQINRDLNDPIDTMGEVSDAREYEEALGNRDVEHEVDKTLDAKVRHKEIMKKYAKSLDLGLDL